MSPHQAHFALRRSSSITAMFCYSWSGGRKIKIVTPFICFSFVKKPAVNTAGSVHVNKISVVKDRGDFRVIHVRRIVIVETGVDHFRHAFTLDGGDRGLDGFIADADRVLGDGAGHQP